MIEKSEKVNNFIYEKRKNDLEIDVVESIILDVLFFPRLIFRLATSPVDALSDVIATLLDVPSGDLIKVEDRGDYIRKYYVIRRLKYKPEILDKIGWKLEESLEPPLRDPRRIKIVEIKPLEVGKFTGDYLIVIDVPKYGGLVKGKRLEIIKKAAEKVKI